MIKSVFISPNRHQGIEEVGANHLIVSDEGLNGTNWQVLKELGIDLGISVAAFRVEDCPANPEVKTKLFERVKRAAKFNPEQLWLDSFRFGGECASVVDGQIPNIHQLCQYCQGKDRDQVICDLARQLRHELDHAIKLGLFVPAFKDREMPELKTQLGLDYQRLGQIVDLTSPMLYHRMLHRGVEYIHELIEWLSQQTNKPILPIIQIKDMPDDLPDEMTEPDIKDAFDQAVLAPSSGVCLFCWDHAIEKDKQSIVKQLFA